VGGTERVALSVHLRTDLSCSLYFNTVSAVSALICHVLVYTVVLHILTACCGLLSPH